MDYLEEQRQELEILESIYPDELIKQSETEFSINLKLDVESENAHHLELRVKYPETYPDVAPELDVVVGQPLEGDENEEDEYDEDDYDDGYDSDESEDEERRAPVIIADTVFFDDDDMKKLLLQMNEELEQNIGMSSVFALLSSLKDLLEVLFQEKVDTLQKLYDDELLKKEMEEQQKFIGTKVTPESFLEWRSKFRKEVGIEEKYFKRFQEIHQGKMTGKEIFEKGLAKLDDGEELADEVEKLAV